MLSQNSTLCSENGSERFVFGTFQIIASVFGSLGNALILVAVITTRELQNKCGILIGNLSFVDFLTNILAIPLFAAYVLLATKGDCKVELHRISQLLSYVLCTISIMTISLMSIDRCLAVWNPTKYKQILSETRIKFLIAATWFSAVLFGVTEATNHFSKQQMVRIMLSGIGILYFVLVSSYGLIFIRMRIQRSKVQCIGSIRQETRRQNEQKLARTIFLVIVLFGISWVPLVYALASKASESSRLYQWAAFISLASASFNPVIYCYRNRQYLKACNWILHLK